MKECIIIENVGPLKHIELEDIKQLTILVGESGSGKSTMMKIIVLMRYIYKMLNIRCYLKNSGVSRSPFKLKIKSLISDDRTAYLIDNREAYIRYIASVNGHDYIVEYKDGDLNTKGASDIPNEDLLFMKESWISESRSIIPMWKSKSAANKKAELGFYFHETLSDFEKATEMVRDLPLDFIGMDLHVEGQNGKRKYYLHPQDHSYESIELKFASSGMQTSTPLATLVYFFARDYSFKEAGRRSILDYLYEQDRLSSYRPEMEIMDLQKQVHVHIEEPELSLFPDAQCKLIDFIVTEAFSRKTDGRKMGVIMATHSPYIVNYLNLLMRRKDSEFANGVSIDSNMLEVYEVVDGYAVPLKTLEERPLIDTRLLSDTIASIYSEYNKY
jgi:predicted ATPase